MTVTQKLRLIVLTTLALAMLSGRAAMSADGKTVYNAVCSFCHDDGTLGSPRRGDLAEWSRRLNQGINKLYTSTLYGKGHMPPRLDRRGYSDDEILSAVDYLAGKAVSKSPLPAPK